MIIQTVVTVVFMWYQLESTEKSLIEPLRFQGNLLDMKYSSGNKYSERHELFWKHWVSDLSADGQAGNLQLYSKEFLLGNLQVR